MAILDGLKAAADALRQADKIPQFQAVLDAQAQIAELQVFNHQQQLEIRRLTEELERVQADQASAEGRKIWANLLWIPEDDEPYCVYCYDKKKRLFHVIERMGNHGLIGRCQECGSDTLQPPPQSYWQWKTEREAPESAEVRFNLPLQG